MGKLTEPMTLQKWVIAVLVGISPLSIISGAIYIGRSMENYESRMFKDYQEKEEVLTTVRNPEIHQNYQQKATDFVPRKEVEKAVDELKDKIKEVRKNQADQQADLNKIRVGMGSIDGKLDIIIKKQ